RRRHTRSKRDWSSDVCSSDLTFNFRIALLGPVPAVCLILVANKMLVFFSLVYISALHRIGYAPHASLQYGVAGHPYHIIQLLAIGQLVEGRAGKAAVSPNRNPHAGIPL